MNNTLDFRAMKQVEELNKKGYYIACDMDILERFMFKYTRISKILTLMGVCFIIWCVTIYWGITTVSADYNELSIQDQIRLERLEICQEAYKSSWINKQFISEEVPAVRCAAFMTLIYAYESDFGRSDKCRNTRNCFWIKWNGVDTPRGFLTFKSETEWRKYFAKKYFKWHYKKSISTFVSNWSMTERDTYISFVASKYNTVYMQLERLYFTR